MYFLEKAVKSPQRWGLRPDGLRQLRTMPPGPCVVTLLLI